MSSQHTKGAQSAQNAILDELRKSLKQQARTATFALGGSVPISTSEESTTKPALNSIERPSHISHPIRPSTSTLRPSKPVHIRFGQPGTGNNLILPTAPTSPTLQHLIQACTPASFGLNGRDIHDANYRKAGKLDTTDFATSFCPYETGIVDVINQVLVTDPCLGTRAELYKLNVYSAPSGLFRAHVDTPRGEEQFGSLVVSLPVAHEGGELVVRHGGKNVVFDWSTSGSKDSQSALQWAAFYSDCEHEVLEVTSGHRITLTYNLYTTRAGGTLAGLESALEARRFPLYASLETALGRPDFLPSGRVLAIHLTHAYAHTSSHHSLLPSSLKGADFAIYETAKSLGLNCYVRPIFRDEWEDCDSDGDFDTSCTILGGRFAELSMGQREMESGREKMEFMREVLDEGERWKPSKVTWINPEQEASIAAQSAIMAYGNQAELELQYSRACLLIRVPRFAERVGHEVAGHSKIFRGIERDAGRAEKDDVSSTDSEREMQIDKEDIGSHFTSFDAGPHVTYYPKDYGRPMTAVEQMLERQRQKFGDWQEEKVSFESFTE
ncbi:unnamed protein product [Zymoseptoria tritici ST99CH_3D7]|uniref:Fe2OG dioxygenase domain-containing protein n=2 Tax=Zymoseptoria tritici TaxID=1047171 RepID=A0A1X7S8J7_ZYMT9|nr:unnamed protein product [Zymoseptoria tritici ST99CH_3D7]SMR61018.1 unnamed protein product [Zymoseptoria tritici ST99CH_1E4]